MPNPSPRFQPTPEQNAITDFARTSKSNLLINALAGTAKTTTLCLIVAKLPLQATLCLSFNKRIATEMQQRMPGHVECATLNSMGHRAWASHLGRKLTVRSNKTADLLKALIDERPKADQRPLWDNFGALQRAVRSAKSSGVVPPGCPQEGLLSFDDFLEDADDDLTLPEGEAASVIAELLRRSIDLMLQGTIDFDDQLYGPTLFGGTFPNFPLVMVDEAQDLSALNHAMLRKIVRKRLIAVGDPFQSIYGFRGAVANGMSALRADFAMEQLGLSVTFRCPKAIVSRAQRRVPHYRAAASAAEGEVIDLRPTDDGGPYNETPPPLWTSEGIPDGAAIICRNNAPLFSVALRLLRAGRGINLVGTDLGPQLLKALKDLGSPTLSQEEVHAAINKWEAARIKRKKSSEAATRDRADCLRVFADAGPTLGEAIRHAERTFSSEGPIQLLSGHKSKGLEWQTVYHLDPWRIPSRFVEPGTEAFQQELNVRYVIETRASQRLILVNAEDLQL